MFFDIKPKGTVLEKSLSLDLSYKSGYEYDSPELEKDKLEKWEIVLAEDKFLHVKLTFVDPIYVATADELSKIEVRFGAGSQYKSKAFGRQLDDDEIKKITMIKQESNDTATKILGLVAAVLKAVLEVLAGGGPVF
jgi:hypothetical protein